jgi:NAD(P)-dependent dehydrogenase (short-subunit alcohol dehydrogenase family)
VALITGGDSGIGAAVAVLFAREGADVAVVHLPAEEEDATNVKALVENDGRRCLLLTGNVAVSAFCEEAVERTVAEFGRLDVLVNNAAVMYQHSLEDVTDADLEELFHTNVLGYFYMARAALKHLRPPAAPPTRWPGTAHKSTRYRWAGRRSRTRSPRPSCSSPTTPRAATPTARSSPLRRPRPGPLNGFTVGPVLARAANTGALLGFEVESDVDDEILLPADQATPADFEKDPAHVDAVFGGGTLGVAEE